MRSVQRSRLPSRPRQRCMTSCGAASISPCGAVHRRQPGKCGVNTAQHLSLVRSTRWLPAQRCLPSAPVHTLDDVGRHTLLATETRPGDWAAAAGLLQPLGQRRVFDHFFVTLQAIVDGLRIGIGPIPVLNSDLTAGRLIAPFPNITVTRVGYVALIPFDADKTPSRTAFLEWLLEEAAS